MYLSTFPVHQVHCRRSTMCSYPDKQSRQTMNDCAICLESVGERDACHLPCGHAFHASCVLQAALHDPRCPVCRVELAKRPAATPSVVNIELTMNDVQNAFEVDYQAMRRQQINYDARRRRFVQRRPDLRQEYAAMREGEKRLKQLERVISDQWAHASRELWTGPTFAALKKERSLLLRRIRRRERIVEAAVEDALGERPEVDDDGEESQVIRAIARAGQERANRRPPETSASDGEA